MKKHILLMIFLCMTHSVCKPIKNEDLVAVLKPAGAFLVASIVCGCIGGIVGYYRGSKKMTEEEERLVAYHEAAHALVAAYSGRRVFSVSIVPKRGNLGYTKFSAIEKHLSNFDSDDLSSGIKIFLAGPCAEIVCGGSSTPGVYGDLEKVKSAISSMLGKWGMAPGSYALMDRNSFSSEKMKETYDALYADIFQKNRDSVMRFLEHHWAEIEMIVEELIEKKRLSEKDFYEIISEEAFDEEGFLSVVI